MAGSEAVSRCDVVMTNSHEVYINGNLVGNVISVSLNRDAHHPPSLILELSPTSITFGDLPKSLLDDLNDGIGEAQEVDIAKALRNAQARRMGHNPNDALKGQQAAAQRRSHCTKKPLTGTYAEPEYPDEEMGG